MHYISLKYSSSSIGSFFVCYLCSLLFNVLIPMYSVSLSFDELNVTCVNCIYMVQYLNFLFGLCRFELTYSFSYSIRQFSIRKVIWQLQRFIYHKRSIICIFISLFLKNLLRIHSMGSMVANNVLHFQLHHHMLFVTVRDGTFLVIKDLYSFY